MMRLVPWVPRALRMACSLRMTCIMRPPLRCGPGHRASPLLLLGCLIHIAVGPVAGAELRPAQAVDAVAAQEPSRWHWRRLPAPSRGDGLGLTAVAAEPAGPMDARSGDARAGRIAIGDGGGVLLRDPSGSFRFAARTRAVTDLRFGPRSALWIASLRGLWHLSPEGQLSERSPAPGEHARSVRRVEVGAGFVCVGTDAGAWVSADGSRWQRVADGLPNGPVSALAIRAPDPMLPGSSAELWLIVADALWRLTVRAEPKGVGVGVGLGPAEQVRIPGTPAGVAAVDVVTRLPGVRVAVAFPQLIAFAREYPAAASSAEDAPIAPSSLRWQIARPVLPPGAQTRRLVAAADAVWLATDLGLLWARDIAGPWRRAGRPAGSAPVWSLAASGDGESLWAVGEQGLFLGTPSFWADLDASDPGLEARLPTAFGAAALAAIADPDIRSVQRAGLRYLGLEPQRFDDLRKGLARRGWLPKFSLRLAGGEDRQRQRDYDEAFLSGETRYLRDYEKERSLSFDASALLTWDFGDVAYNPESIDLSRESRLVISLRDGVLDEINQLYYERRGLLQQLAAGPRADGPDPRQLELRAAELTAGLDAWTGGWFSEVRAARAARTPWTDGAQEVPERRQ